MSENDEVIQEFLTESFEGLEQTERDLVALEQAPKDQDILGRIFRCVHTIKGTCSFFGYTKLEKIAHIGENILTQLRSGEADFTEDKATILLKMSDAIGDMLTNIQDNGTEGETDYSDLVVELERCANLQVDTEAEFEVASSEQGDVQSISNATVEFSETAETTDPPLDVKPLELQEKVANVLVDKPQLEEEEFKAKATTRSEIAGDAPAKVDTTIRVSVELIDKLMNLVGELVLARNQTLQFCHTFQDRSFIATTQRLNLVTTELQESIMQTRMQPIGNVWNKFPRVVRDLAKSSDKLIQLHMEGKNTELDKTLIEAIKDPLTHLIRNCSDHGVETPAARLAAGKSEEGNVYLRSFHEGGQVIIEIEDDGNGIDPQKLKSTAEEKGMISSQRLKSMNDREALELVFLPGFSTATKITNVSGRGVGMDVVKTNIERIGGTVDIKSELGKYTAFRIKIPLTLAIIPALTISCGKDQFAIPQVSLVELVRVDNSDSKNTIEWIDDTPVYRLRDKLLPIVYLTSELEINTESPANTTDEYNIVVLQADNHQFGLVVDDVHETEEIVVKPLGKQLIDIGVFAGATIMGDGKVALILDVLGLARRAGLNAEHKESIEEKTTVVETAKEDMQSILLCQIANDQRIAVPLQMVSRLEEFATDKVEAVGSNQVIQYRGKIMQLLDVSQSLNGQALQQDDSQDTKHVIVHNYQGNDVGVIVERIEDIVQESVSIDPIGRREGTIGSAIVQDKVVEFLDVENLISTTSPELSLHL